MHSTKATQGRQTTWRQATPTHERTRRQGCDGPTRRQARRESSPRPAHLESTPHPRRHRILGALSRAVLPALLLGFATVSAAETRVDLVPSVAYFNPTANVVDEGGITARFDNAVGLGGRLTIWLNDAIALEGTGHFVRSSLDAGFLGDGTFGSIDLSLFYGSAQVVVGLGTEKRLLLHGGLGMQGSNYDEYIEGGNALTGVLGLGGWAPLGETVALRSDLDAHFHTTWYEVGDVRSEELSQVDLLLSIGLQFTPGGR
ncbi:MAG: hypothetical protein R3E97_23755 [Candidatus Eisenbacteria bacterium]